MTRPMSFDDVAGFKILGDAQISPDGERVAFVVSDPWTIGDELPQRSSIWLAVSREGSTRRLSSGIWNDSSPRWSTRGELAFLSDRGSPGVFRPYVWDAVGDAQLLIRPSAGMRLPVSVEGMAVETPALHTAAASPPLWSPVGRQVALLLPDPPSAEHSAEAGANNDAVVHGQSGSYQRIWVVDVDEAGAVLCVSPPGLQVWEVDWSPDAKSIVCVASDSPTEDSWYESRLVAVDVARGTVREVCKAPDRPTATSAQGAVAIGRQLACPKWSPDGDWMGFISNTWSDRGLVGGDIYVVSSGGGEPRNLTEGEPLSVSWYEWIDGTTLKVAALYEGEQILGVLRLDGSSVDVDWRAQAALADRVQPKFSLHSSGAMAMVREGPRDPREVWMATPEADGLRWEQLSRLQPSIDHLDLAEMETLHWEGHGGLPIQGILLRPAGAQEPTPMVVYPHGGPVMHSGYLFRGWIEGPYAIPFELLPAHGIAVLLPNQRGSFGWGARYTESIVGDHGGADLDDVLAGVDHCVSRGLADPDRLGIAGWSSSAYLAARAIVATDRFSAALVGAGMYDLRSLYASMPAFCELFYGPDPYRSGGRYEEMSPLAQVDRVTTPTLIVHNEEDSLLPLGQALSWYSALRHNGSPVELVTYPREGHATKNQVHQMDLMERWVAWFSHWFGLSYPPHSHGQNGAEK